MVGALGQIPQQVVLELAILRHARSRHEGLHNAIIESQTIADHPAICYGHSTPSVSLCSEIDTSPRGKRITQYPVSSRYAFIAAACDFVVLSCPCRTLSS